MSSPTVQSELPMKNVVPPGDANDNGGLVVPNNTPFSNPPSEDGDVDFEDEHKYPSDSYSFLALHGPRDDLVFFSFGVMAFLFQFTFLLLMIISVVAKDQRSGQFGEVVDNPGNPGSGEPGWFSEFFPANTSKIVRATLATSILSFIVFANHTMIDIARATEMLPPFWSTSYFASKSNGNRNRN